MAALTKVRLDKLLSNLGLTTRRTYQDFIKKNKITVKGKTVLSGSELVNPNDLYMGDSPLPYPNELYIMMHKPRGYTSSRERDSQSDQIVFDILPETFLKRRPLLGVAGRLDKWASGLLVLSQDGKFVSRLISPKKAEQGLGKVYEVTLQKDMTGKEKEMFESGEMLLRSEEKPCKPAKIEMVDTEKRIVRITLYEGKYHQLRRMLAVVGNRAIEIKRVQVGPLKLGDLQVGHWRELSKEEVESVNNIGKATSNVETDFEMAGKLREFHEKQRLQRVISEQAQTHGGQYKKPGSRNAKNKAQM
jgi:16S rRNA pseudouridine516 synthase